MGITVALLHSSGKFPLLHMSSYMPSRFSRAFRSIENEDVINIDDFFIKIINIFAMHLGN
jgi:hypothetical protein